MKIDHTPGPWELFHASWEVSEVHVGGHTIARVFVEGVADDDGWEDE